MAHKMNCGPGGQQPKMHNTVIPGTDIIQSMIYPDNCIKWDGNGESLAGKAKGMEQVSHEWGLLEDLAKASKGGKPVGVCATCKMSQVARDKAAKAAKSC
jgi:hypothetical protein